VSAARPGPPEGQIPSAITWHLLGRVLSAGLQLVLLVVLARLLGSGDFGLWAAATVVVSVTQATTQLGVGAALIQRGDDDPRLVSTALLLASGLGVIGMAALLAGAGLTGRLFGIGALPQVLGVAAPLLAITGLGVTSEARLMRSLAFRDLAMIDSLSFALGNAAVAIALAMAGFGVWALVAAQYGQSLLRTGLLVARRPPRLDAAPSFQAAGLLLGYGALHTLAELGNVVALQADNAVVGRTLGAGQLGLYTRAYGLLAGPARLIGLAFDKVLFPALSVARADRERMAGAFLKSLGAIAMVTAPLGVLLSILAPEIVRLALGPRWVDLTVAFQVLALTLTFRSSYKAADAVARATSTLGGRAWRQWLYAAMVLVGAALGQRWGLTGVAVAVSVAIIMHFTLMVQLSLRILGVSWIRLGAIYFRACLATLPAAAVVMIATMAMRRLGAGDISVIAFAVTAWLAAGAVTYVVAPQWRPEGWDQLQLQGIAAVRLALRRVGL
jgi:O-antigen/teichoic acid export membrane protein